MKAFSSNYNHVLSIIGRGILQYRPNSKGLICTIGFACPKILPYKYRENTLHYKAKSLKFLPIAVPTKQATDHVQAKKTLQHFSIKWTTKPSLLSTLSTLCSTPTKPHTSLTTCRIGII